MRFGCKRLIGGWWLKVGPFASMWYRNSDETLSMKVKLGTIAYERRWKFSSNA